MKSNIQDKERINPLNYGEHLRLKYNIRPDKMSESLQKLIFEADMKDELIICFKKH